jgi:hypothetical protein
MEPEAEKEFWLSPNPTASGSSSSYRDGDRLGVTIRTNKA